MKITFLGATRTVTGSCYLLEIQKRKILIDCGMFQGTKLIKAFNEKNFLFNPHEVEAVILTHAHIDHSGLLPKLVKLGFLGKIHCTKSTKELCSILLPDSAHIQESDAEYANSKGMRAGKKLVLPLFTVDDAYKTMSHFEVHDFDEKFSVLPGVNVNFRVAGHILGSAFVEITVVEGTEKTKLVFTGDIGQPAQPIIEDPTILNNADFIITESIYGNRIHEKYDKEGELAKIINDTAKRGGNIIIPAFAVGRTQVLLYYFQKLQAEGKIPEIPIYVDSPMANKATQITLSNPDEYDEEARALCVMQGGRLVAMNNLHFTATVQESMAINDILGSKIIISASGMADAGRILHHLKHNLWRADSSVVFAGYQAEGTIGRSIIEGSKRVKIMGEDIRVNAKIYNMKGFSAHADKEQLLNWYSKLKYQPKAFFVTHGELDASMELADILRRRLGTAAYIPHFGDCAEIYGTSWQIHESEIVRVEPAAVELRAYLRNLERGYLLQRAKIEQIVSRDAGKAAFIRKKMEKLQKYMDELFRDI